MKALILISLLLTGCSASFQLGQSKGVSKDEIAQAFQQRDQVLVALGKEIEKLKQKEKP